MRIGVLSFHGDFAEHIALLELLKIKATEVRSIDDLFPLTHLIIPGGESTVISRFLKDTGVGEGIKTLVQAGDLAVYGTCAGAILVAQKVTGKNAPESLGILDMTVERNAYGTQRESFAASLSVKGLKKPVPVAFIRAPIIGKTGKDVQVLASYKGNPVLVAHGRVLAGTFHPEIRGETAIHRMFLEM